MKSVKAVVLTGIFLFIASSVAAHTKCKVNLGFGNWTEGCPHIHPPKESHSYIPHQPNTKSKNYREDEIVGVWIIKASNGYMTSVHLYRNNKAGTLKRKNQKYSLSGDRLKIFFAGDSDVYIDGVLLSKNRLSVQNNSLWKTGKKVSSNPNRGIDLYEVTRNKGSNEWYCANIGQGDYVYSTIPWFNGTSTNYSDCKKKCREMVKFRRSEGFIETCRY